MKTRMKRLISLLCVVTVFATTVLSTDFLSAKAETNNEQAGGLQEGMTEITFKDFEAKNRYTGKFKDGDYTSWTYGLYGGETMNNTFFSGKIIFPENGGSCIQYGGVGGWTGGFEIAVGYTNSVGYYLRLRDTQTPAAFTEVSLLSSVAGTALVGEEILLGLSLEYVNRDSGATDNDLKLGVWFNGKLYNNEYIYIDNYVDKTTSIGKYLTVIPNGGTIHLESHVEMPEDMTEINFTDFGITDGTVSKTMSASYAGSTMNKTLFSGEITFSETGETHFMYGGTKAWGGFILTNVYDESKDEHYLRLYDSNADANNGGSKKFNDYKFYVDKTDLDTFVGKSFRLNYTMEYVNNDGGTTNNDLKLGVWFNGKLYDYEYIYINDYVDNGHSVGGYITVWPRNGATFTMKSFNYQLPTNLTDISFRDFGVADGTYTKWKGQEYTGETLKNTLFSGIITFPEVEKAQLSYAGKGTMTGIELIAAKSDADGWYLRLRDSKNKAFTEKKLTSAVAGVQLVGTALDLSISLEYVNIDAETTDNDVKLGVWFGGKLYNDEYLYIEDYADAENAIGKWLTYIPKTGSIVVKSADIKMPTDMQHLSFRDFGLADGNMTGYTTCGQYEGESLDNTLFRGNVAFPEKENVFIQYAGKAAGGGFNIGTAYSDAKGYYLRLFDTKYGGASKMFNDCHFYSDQAGSQLVGTTLDLALSVEYVDHDGGGSKNDVKLGVWFNEKLYQNTYIYLDNFVDHTHSMGTWMNLYVGNNKILNIESVGEINWKEIPDGLTEITFRDFGIADGDVTGYATSGQYEGNSLDKTLFSGKVTFPEIKDIFIQYGGKVAGGGFNIGTGYTDADGYYLRLYDTNQDKSGAKFSEKRFYSDKAGVTLVGTELDLKLSMEYVDHDGSGAANDVKLGVWFNGRLYQNVYIYLDNFVDHTHSMGTWMQFYVGNNKYLPIESVGEINWKSLPTGMTEITFRDFGYVDGEISGYPGKKYEGESLDNTLFSGKITFPEVKDVFMQYGGKENATGINIGTAYDADNDEWYLRVFNAKKTADETVFAEKKLYADIAQVDKLVGEELELNLTVEYVDYDGDGKEDDVKFGVWFNGKLYNNSYMYLMNYVDMTYSMGNYLSFYVASSTKIDIQSVGTINWKPLPEGFTEITFRDFGFIDGDITKYPTGEYEGDTLDKTLFTGKITFPKSSAAHIMYGGKVGGGGFDIVPAENTETGEWYLRLFDTNQDKSGRKFSEYKFYADVAGVPLVGEEVALSLSLEYIDYNGDGKKDDVKLGVWFGGKLYNNNYIYLEGFADTGHSMGTWMGFSVSKTTSIKIKSVGEIDWKPLPTGFTELTFEDFGFKAGSYEGGTKTGNCERDSMDKTILSGVVMYSTVGETHFTYGGTKGLSGLDLVNVYNKETGEHYLRLFDTNADKKGKLFSDMYFYSDVAGVTLVGEELELKLSMEYVNHDGGKTNNDLKLGVWFAGKLYNNRYIYIDNYVDNSHSIGSYMTLWVRNGATFNVGRISDWLKWEAFGLTSNWKKILLDTDFNLEYALAGGNPYTGDSVTAPYLLMGACLAAVVLCGCQIARKERRKNE